MELVEHFEAVVDVVEQEPVVAAADPILDALIERDEVVAAIEPILDDVCYVYIGIHVHG